MSIAYFDCFAGSGGDMIVGALIDAGADFNALKAELSKLGLEGYSLRVERVNRGGLVGTKFHVDFSMEGHSHRHLGDILAMIDRAGLSPRAADRARRIFTRLGQAEAKIHQMPVEEVHFHEVGAVDSIVDVVGSCIAMDLLDIERVICSAIPLGSGTVQCEHGLLPVPAPATAELLVGALTVPGALEGEMTTPTAAAILSTLAESYGPIPEMTLAAIGYGAGSRSGGALPNLLRVLIGQGADAGTVDTVVELSANIDDSSGVVLGSTIEKLLAAGCVDAWAGPIVMKKSRPAWMISVLCGPDDVAEAERILFAETTTFGIRRRVCARSKLSRRFETVETAYGPVRIKIGQLGQQVVSATPEFADCASAAQAHGVSVREVILDAQATWRREE